MVECTVEIDLSSMGGNNAILPAKLLFGEHKQPYELIVDITNTHISFADSFFQNESPPNWKITCHLQSGETVEGTIAYIRGTNFSTNSRHYLRLQLHKCIKKSKVYSQNNPAKWIIELTNTILHFYDIPSFGPPITVGDLTFPKWLRRDIVQLNISNRDWELKDILQEQGKPKDSLDKYHPVITAILTTPYNKNDRFETINRLITEIEILLSFALSKGVRAVSYSLISKDDKLIETYYIDRLLFPMREGGFAPVDNWSPGVLKSFIEKAYPVITNDYKWWELTFDLILQSRLCRFLDIACVQLNVILDRISNKHMTNSSASEIDTEIQTKSKDISYKGKLHNILSELSPQWNKSHTGIILSRINEINLRPSFSNAINRLCDKYNLTPPSNHLLAIRHKMVHTGEFPHNTNDIYAYWDELDWLVTGLLLRMLNYEGQIYHRKFGSWPIKF